MGGQHDKSETDGWGGGANVTKSVKMKCLTAMSQMNVFAFRKKNCSGGVYQSFRRTLFAPHSNARVPTVVVSFF